MNLFSKGALAAASVLALTATTASAEIVCNGEGDCWHVRERHVYRPEFGVRVYPDDWRWRETEASATDGASTKAVATGATAFGSSSKYWKAASLLLEEEPPTCVKV